tara:strand:+ start:1621 stop:1815 length:195 start_codon:yes stop_codon:yes gene_type:complete
MPIVYRITTGVSVHEGEWLEEIADSQCIEVEKLVANILKDYVNRYKSETSSDTNSDTNQTQDTQ